jgi:hypothetical protein
MVPKPAAAETVAHKSPPITTRTETKPAPPPVRYSLPQAGLLVQPMNLPPALRARFDSAMSKVPRASVLADRSAGTPHLMIEANPAGQLIARNPIQARGLDRADTAINTLVLTGLLRRELGALDLATLDRAGSGGVRLESVTPSHDYIEKDELRFKVSSKRGGYLTLVDLGASGVATILYPSGRDSLQALAPNAEVLLPPQDETAWEANAPFGLGRVRAIVSSAPLKFNTTGESMYVSTDGSELSANILAQLETIVRAGGWWETSAFPYTITANKKK